MNRQEDIEVIIKKEFKKEINILSLSKNQTLQKVKNKSCPSTQGQQFLSFPTHQCWVTGHIFLITVPKLDEMVCTSGIIIVW